MKTRLLLISIILFFKSYDAFCQFPANSFSSVLTFVQDSLYGSDVNIADLNNDGKKEIITSIQYINSLKIYTNSTTPGVLNNSSFTNLITLTTANNNPAIIVTADLNNDGKLDIVLGYRSTSNYISIFLNQYNGTSFNASSFTRYDFLSGGSGPEGLTVADFDLDGKPDIAITSNTGYAHILRNTTGTASTLTFASPISLATGSTSSGLISSDDIDNDGKKDLVITNYGANSITVYRNTTSSIGSISFSLITASIHSASTRSNPYWIKITDFDNNGLKEILVSNYNSDTLSLFVNTSSTGITLAARIDLPMYLQYFSSGISISDFDADGKTDIAVVMNATNSITCFKNLFTSGSLSAASFSTITNFPSYQPAGALASADLDGDLRPDLVVSNGTNLNIAIFKNNILANQPTIQSTNLSVIPASSSVSLSFTKGNGNRRLVVAKSNTSASVAPVDSSIYVANSIFGSGTNIGSNNYVVYADTGSNVNITGLTYGQTYNFTVYEYNGLGGYSNYLTTTPATITQTIGDFYYSKSSGALNLLSSWGSNTDGTGTSPTTFINSNAVFIIANNTSPTISANWTLTGTNSYLAIGNGINALNFTIPAGLNLIVDSIAVKPNATLTFIGELTSSKAYFDTLSTAQFNNSSAQNIPDFPYYNLLCSNSIKTLTANCTVRGNLNLLCNINTGVYILTLGISGAQTGTLTRTAGGTITGRFKRWFAATSNSGTSGLFPMLVGTNYRPSLVEFTSAPSVAGTLSTEFFSTAAGNSGLPLYDFSVGFIEVNKASNSGYWKIDPIGISGGVYTLTLTGTGFTGISSPSDLRLVKRTTTGAWTLPSGTTAIPGTGSNSAPVVGRSGYAGFGEFTIASDSTINPLPVKWLSFDGGRNEEGVLLKWKTAQEINNAYFIVERKTEQQKDFETIQKVLPLKSGSIKSYTFLDQNHLTNEPLIYRIKQIDLDGKWSYSNTILIRGITLNDELIVSPNPAQDYLVIKNYLSSEAVELIDAQGKIIAIKIDNDKIKLNNIPAGIYFLNISNLNAQRKIIKIIKE